MAVTKRTRYEVLRRDEFTCRYCHSNTSEMTVDHVVPVSLGGTDAPDNLVAACRDCNAGKSSAHPDSQMVAHVSEETLRYAERARQAWTVMVEGLGSREEYIAKVCRVLDDMIVPPDFRESIGRWFDMGVPVEIVTAAASAAANNQGYFSGDGQFRYFCKIVWTQVREVNGAVAKKESALDGAWMTGAEIRDTEERGRKKGLNDGRLEHLLDIVLVDFIDRNQLEPRYEKWDWAMGGAA